MIFSRKFCHESRENQLFMATRLGVCVTNGNYISYVNLNIIWELLVSYRKKLSRRSLKFAMVLTKKIRKRCLITLLSCAYAGTGNVLKVIYFWLPGSTRRSRLVMGSNFLSLYSSRNFWGSVHNMRVRSTRDLLCLELL